MKKQSKAKQILAYAAKNPSASCTDIAKATRSTYGYVYKVVNKKVATPHAHRGEVNKVTTSDGSTADYYVLPENAHELQDLISHKNMNAQIGEIFRACYRYGEVAHSEMLRDAKKIKFYAEAEIKRLENLK